MRSVFRVLVFISVLCTVIKPARAQLVDAYLGLGGAHDSSNHQQVDTFGNGVLYPTGGITGVFVDFGLGVMIGRHLGTAFDISWKAEQGTYTGIKYRPVFYSFDAVYQPPMITRKRFAPELRVGIGGASLHYSPDAQQSCVNGPACQNSDHFQIHFAVAGRIYVTDHLFFRPAIDGHAVHQFNEFGSNWVTEYSVGVGYSLGRE